MMAEDEMRESVYISSRTSRGKFMKDLFPDIYRFINVELEVEVGFLLYLDRLVRRDEAR
jgi:hypothetical protein